MEHRDLNQEELSKLNEFIEVGLRIVSYYFPEEEGISPDLLDDVFEAWVEDKGGKPSEQEIAHGLGALLGDYLQDSLQFEWKIRVDEQGECHCLKASNGWETFPIIYVWKRADPAVVGEELGFFGAAWDLFSEKVPERS